MNRWIKILVLVGALLITGQAVADEQDGGQWFLARVAEAIASGEITQEEGLLLKFQYVFDQQRLPAEFRPAQFTPLKCGTPFVVEFAASRGGLSSATVEVIEGYLAGPAGDQSRAIYISPSGNFRLTYYTSGGDAVPPADVDPPNGVPDFVERCASYCDFSRTWGRTATPALRAVTVRPGSRCTTTSSVFRPTTIQTAINSVRRR